GTALQTERGKTAHELGRSLLSPTQEPIRGSNIFTQLPRDLGSPSNMATQGGVSPARALCRLHQAGRHQSRPRSPPVTLSTSSLLLRSQTGKPFPSFCLCHL
ncbi:hypothetical protein VIGAN_09036400, partial [Vigna angularis var. angularis]